jgi:hypothetical protein
MLFKLNKQFQKTKEIRSFRPSVTQGIALTKPHILADIHPESNKKVNDQGRSHGEKGNINKILPDGAGSNTHFFTKPGANAKHIPFNDSS